MKVTTVFGRGLLPSAFTLALAAAACAEAQSSTSSGPAKAPWPAICPPTWQTAPRVAASLVPPGPALRVVGHAAAKGTQNYKCAASPADGGAAGYGWTFIGPEATLTDCTGATLGRHFASPSDGGSPKWQAEDGSFVVGRKVAADPSPEAGTIPWLLLKGTGGGAGALSGVTYIQRTATKGGAVPPLGCDEAQARAGTVAKVPYGADYWFFGPP